MLPPPPELLLSWCEQQREVIPKRRSDPVAQKYYRYHSRLLGLTIAASFSLTRGAGGLSIAPSLSFQIPVSPNDPGFVRSVYIRCLGSSYLLPTSWTIRSKSLSIYLG